MLQNCKTVRLSELVSELSSMQIGLEASQSVLVDASLVDDNVMTSLSGFKSQLGQLTSALENHKTKGNYQYITLFSSILSLNHTLVVHNH